MNTAPPRTQNPSVSLPQSAADANAQPESQAPPAAPSKAKYPRGDRSHIPASAQPIVDLLTPEIARIKAVAPQQYKPQVDDMEKRLNILFDHLNNEDLLSDATVQEMVSISTAVKDREWDQALSMFNDMQTAKMESEGTHWMVSSPYSDSYFEDSRHADTIVNLGWC
jgi:protein transport protein SEC31